jgi:hypothetical protein
MTGDAMPSFRPYFGLTWRPGRGVRPYAGVTWRPHHTVGAGIIAVLMLILIALAML